ncbi:hypothetical protein IDM40_02200 [Nocardiopsis sp. HNM0947]|uniref:GNAT family N-acetyltransferase n=1 Tax=Nocardiopsis coralli TaxID=2772213 RepID=A0ABR9P0Y2_9ACTN|nr:hypothetical protein [Nocardiopsis coralli]MBE2997518.1 hypothetical protein [Nocardiopsis coralli]
MDTPVDYDRGGPVPVPEGLVGWAPEQIEDPRFADGTRVLSLTMHPREGEAVRVALSRAVHGRWARSYPVGARDIVLEVVDRGSASDAVAALGALTSVLLEQDPRCRRIVAPCPLTDLSLMALLEEAGFVFVTEVDEADGTHGLMLLGRG